MSYIEIEQFPIKRVYRIPVRTMAKKGAVKSLFTTFEETETPSDDAIKVFLRLKPSTNDGDNIIEVLDSRTILFKVPPNLVQSKKKLNIPDQYKYTFSSIFRPDVRQGEIFSGCVSNHVKDLFAGQHCLLFTYGTTNAGKTFTVLGTGEQPGIIPRTLTTVFKSIRGKEYRNARVRPHMFNSALEVGDGTLKEEMELKQQILNWNPDKSQSDSTRLCKSQSSEKSSINDIFGDSVFKQMQSRLTNDTTTVDYEAEPEDRFSVWISFAEIYNEAIFDLLQPVVSANCKRKQLKLAQDNRKNCYIKGLRHVFVQSEEEAYKVLVFGKNNLQVAATGMNSRSSRSHCIFSVKLMKCANVESPERVVVSSFSICDLAGAERQKKTLNVGQRLKESQNINCSLHVLSRCFSTIRENQLNNEHKLIPFRDSKLTQLFQHALLGRESVTMIVNVNSEHHLCEETQHVLKASAIAKHIVVQPRITRCLPRPTRTSRFSHIVRHNRSTLIRWDSCVKQKVNEGQHSSVVDDTVTTISEVEEKGEQYENLLALVESLKEKIKEEKSKHLQTKKNCRIQEDNIREEMRKELSDKLEQARTQSEFDYKRAQELADGGRNRGERIISMETHTRPKRPRTDTEAVEEEDTLEVEDLREEISVQQKQIDGLTELVNILRDEKNEVTMNLTSVSMQLSWRDKDIQNLKRKIEMFADEDELKAGYVALQKEMEVKIEIRDNLLDEARNDLLEELRIRDEHESDIARLEQELSEKEEENYKILVEMEDLKQEVKSRTHGMDMLESRIEEMEEEEILFQTEQKKNIGKYEDQIKILKDENETLKKEVENLLSTQTPNTELEKQIEELKEQLEETRTTYLKLKEEQESLFQTSQKETIANYEDQLNMLKDKNETLKKEVENVLYKSTATSEIELEKQKETEELKKQLEETQTTFLKLKEEKEALQNQVRCVSDEPDKENNKILEKQKEIEELKKQLEETRTTCQKLKLEKEALQNQVSWYPDEVDKENYNVFETGSHVLQPERCAQATRSLAEQLTEIAEIRTRSRSTTTCDTRASTSSRISRSTTKSNRRQRNRAQNVSPVTVGDFDSETKPVDKLHKQTRKKLWDAGSNETNTMFDDVEIDLSIPQDSPRTIMKRNLRTRNKGGRTQQTKKKSSTHSDSCCLGCYPLQLRTNDNDCTDRKYSRRKLFSQDYQVLQEIDISQFDFEPKFKTESPCTYIRRVMKRDTK